ncbi:MULTISPECIES: sugar phosphate isomerase/epimerase family protein [Roseobacteraceae]|uniref:Xylose isomerase n=1 Tax=Celeribacter baekdonensis B30 TaxID=1208323 RepID=K2JB06_9RHOB|nr:MULTISPECIES: sugar phosphate isomerase/epimerase family protein [Roseobacteraceae]EKE67689.1 xylose isomerase [Celeribacter baekdonensis B30]KAB6715607.1 sugar phosphate isomerase/epimerase [Roseobacter sp. TSBP12]|tara:strand:- start:11612 stop:12427 length:816 start_codon:yes stop_codon:yes gene_type:complete
MLPLKIGACLKTGEIASHREWLFEADRDIEVQDFMTHAALTGEFEARIAAAKTALVGHAGRVGIHGPYEGLDLDNKDPELRPLITARFLRALEAADRIGARQMVLHSPYTRWYKNNLLCTKGYAEAKLKRIQSVLTPVVRAAEDMGITLVIENIQDVDPATRRKMVESFASPSVALSIDTGHAHLARCMSGAPPVDYFVRDAGEQLQHIHIQDVDGYADRHWAPGEGDIEWSAVFRALSTCARAPHVVLELRNKADIPKGYAYLKGLGLVA